MDVTVEELAIESFYPADETTAAPSASGQRRGTSGLGSPRYRELGGKRSPRLVRPINSPRAAAGTVRELR